MLIYPATIELNPQSAILSPAPSNPPAASPTWFDPSEVEIILCYSSNSCRGETVQCTENKPCQIDCYNSYVCENARILCNPTYNTPCRVEGTFLGALKSAKITAKDVSLDVYCEEIESCEFAVINHEMNANEVTIRCNGYRSCEDIELFCPGHHSDGTKQCHLIGIVSYTLCCNRLLKCLYHVLIWSVLVYHQRSADDGSNNISSEVCNSRNQWMGRCKSLGICTHFGRYS